MVKDSTDHEMLHIWGLIPHEKRDYKSLQNKAKQSNLDVEDPMLFKLLIAQSMIETKDYKVLTTIEEYDNLINASVFNSSSLKCININIESL